MFIVSTCLSSCSSLIVTCATSRSIQLLILIFGPVSSQFSTVGPYFFIHVLVIFVFMSVLFFCCYVVFLIFLFSHSAISRSLALLFLRSLNKLCLSIYLSYWLCYLWQWKWGCMYLQCTCLGVVSQASAAESWQRPRVEWWGCHTSRQKVSAFYCHSYCLLLYRMTVAHLRLGFTVFNYVFRPSWLQLARLL